MGNRVVSVHEDHAKVGKIIDALWNPLTTVQRTALAATLSGPHESLFCWDLDENKPYWWNGSAFVSPSGTQSGLTPKGSIAYNGTEPTTPTLGDLYVFSSAGVNTWEGSVAVQIADQVWFDGTAWQFIQGNVIAATESVPGILAIASQAEVNTGTDDTKAVTAAKLAVYIAGTKKLAKTYYAGSLTLVADTPLTIAHSLNLQNRDACLISFKVGNSEEEIDFDTTDVNNLTITANRAITGGSIFVIGY